MLSFLFVGPNGAVNEQVLLHQSGALIYIGFFEPELLGLLQRMKLPLMLVDLQAPGLPCVNPDNTQDGYLVAQHLITQGRSRVASLTNTLAYCSIRQRGEDCRRALCEARLLMPPEYEAVASPLPDTDQSLVKAVNELLRLPEPPDAIFVYNDVAAPVVQRVCAQQGVHVPEDLTLVGFGDIGAATWLHPPPTTIAVDKQQLGCEALRLLQEENQKGDPLLPVQLIVRDSPEK